MLASMTEANKEAEMLKGATHSPTMAANKEGEMAPAPTTDAEKDKGVMTDAKEKTPSPVRANP
jgi:hypothetical protein